MKIISSRRKHEREPREGYIQTLKLSLIPDAKLEIVFWFIMLVIGTVFYCIFKNNPLAQYFHGFISAGALAIMIKYCIRLYKLKKDLKSHLEKFPEYK